MCPEGDGQRTILFTTTAPSVALALKTGVQFAWMVFAHPLKLQGQASSAHMQKRASLVGVGVGSDSLVGTGSSNLGEGGDSLGSLGGDVSTMELVASRPEAVTHGEAKDGGESKSPKKEKGGKGGKGGKGDKASKDDGSRNPIAVYRKLKRTLLMSYVLYMRSYV